MDSLRRIVSAATSRRFLVAYSGGLDSHVLLHQLVHLRSFFPDLVIRALHLNHGLHSNADQWAEHCASVCKEFSVPLIIDTVLIDSASGESVEALARHARYTILGQNLSTDESLFTGHTLDDQAETVLLQLCRGAGPKGLSAMPHVKKFLHSLHYRPFLSMTRETILAYGKSHSLSWIEDTSNQDLRFDRNFLRAEIFPLLYQRWPSVLKTIARSAKHCAATTKMIEALADKDISNVLGKVSGTLNVSKLLLLSSERRKHVLRRWFTKRGVEISPSTIQLQQCEQDVLHSRTDANPIFCFGKFELRRYRDDLYLLSSDDSRTSYQVGFLPKYRNLSHCTIRFRQGGERVRFSSDRPSQSLKKLFHQWGVPPWERDWVPLLYDGDRIVEVVGYWVYRGS